MDDPRQCQGFISHFLQRRGSETISRAVPMSRRVYCQRIVAVACHHYYVVHHFSFFAVSMLPNRKKETMNEEGIKINSPKLYRLSSWMNNGKASSSHLREL